jgi:coiled-coil domain-containing protein 55
VGAMAFNMTMKKPGKKYGLVKPKAKAKAKPGLAAFAAADEDEEDAPMTAHEQVNYAILQAQASEARKKKAEASYTEALEQDETVFDYDGVYDQMQEKRAESAQARKKKESVRAPKYINNILKMAEYKKREEERVKERVEARERLKELEEFGDTEKFVTSAYKRKLEEWQTLDQEDARQAAVEAAQDVRKKDNMDSFYVNLMHDNVSMGQMFDKTNPAAADGEGAAAAAAGAAGGGGGGGGAGASGGASAGGGGGDGDGVELGIAGGTQMTFDSAMASKEEAAQPRQRAVQRSDGKAEAKKREDKAASEEAERAKVKMAKRNDDASVASAKERYLARKAAAAAAKAAGQ